MPVGARIARQHGFVLYENRQRAETFGEDAERYDRARPSYPPELIAAVLQDRPHRVLDVGCGTGIAARLLAVEGRDLLGVEVDDRMAAIARRHGIEVETGRFETWDPAGRRFDLLTSAQAWHWVNPTAGAAKAADVLEPEGRIALWWNTASPPADIHAALVDAYERMAPGTDADSALLAGGGTARFALAGDTLRANGNFTEPEIRSFPHDRSYTTAEWLDQLPTHSVHRQLPAERLSLLLEAVAGVLDDAGGRFVMHYDTWLVTAQRR